jgi:hypothetical protein
MTEQQAIQFLSEVRRPLLALHKAILDHERASYEKEFGPATPAAFLQVFGVPLALAALDSDCQRRRDPRRQEGH